MTKYNALSVNIRYENENDKYQWKDRKYVLKNMIDKINPDFIGFQEVKSRQLDDLVNFFSEKYYYYGEFREESETAEMNPVFVKKDKFLIEDKKTLWLSDTPYEKHSNTWDGDLPRICSYATVIDKNTHGKILKFINTHFDHVGVEARIKSSDLIENIIDETNFPVLLMGDFNTVPSDGYIDTLLNKENLENSYDKLQDKENSLTIHNYTDVTLGEPIDYIFVKSPFNISKSEVLRIKENDIYSSDHNHIYIEFEK